MGWADLWSKGSRRVLGNGGRLIMGDGWRELWNNVNGE